MRPLTLLGMALLLAGCGRSSSGVGPAASTVAPGVGPSPVTSSSATAGPVSTSSTTSPTTGPGPSASAGARVALTPQGISVGGRTRLLYGAEVQYFRIRDPGLDVARTHRLWEDTLDLLVGAGMNLVTTYVPWDYHEPQEGQFNFSGVADLEAFLDMCHARGLAVVIKPGPFINSEWPNGLGSFGAIPEWFKLKHPSALALGPNGQPFSVDLVGRADGRQPSFFAPELLQATERWFARLAPTILRYVHQRPTIVGLQIDNETNFYFASRYASDYSAHGLRQFRGFLAARYGTIADLNAAYGATYASFDDVDPPRAVPDRNGSPQESLRHQDWFDAGQAGIAEYQRALRATWERLGVREPDVLLCTNDSPHSFPEGIPGRRDVLLWDATAKNQGGVPMLDAYPKQLPTTNVPLDLPFLTSFFSRRFAASADAYRFAGGAPAATGKCYGAELEGGLFSLPLVNVAIPLPVASTDHVLLQHLGRGSALASLYVFRAGLNRDGSPYFTNAAVRLDGTLHPRYEVLRRFGRLVTQHGDDLLRSEEVLCDVAVAVDSRFDAPAAGIAGHPGRIQTTEAPAVFGMLEDAGLNPAVVDLRDAAPGALAPYRLVFFLNPDVVDERVAGVLDGYVRQGGHLVNLLHTGRFDARWRAGTVTDTLLARGLFGDGALVGLFENNLLARGNVNLRVPAGPQGALPVGPFLGQYRLLGPAVPLAFDRTFPFGRDGAVAGWTAPRGAGVVAAFGTNVASVYASGEYYAAEGQDLLRLRALARWLAARAGARGPIVSVRDALGTAWARRVPGAAPGGSGDVFVFVGGRSDRAGQVTLDVHDLAALGLSAQGSYTVEEALTGNVLASGLTGADLAAHGLTVPLAAWGTAVLRVR